MKNFFLVLLMLVCTAQFVVAERRSKVTDFCSSPDGSCHHQGKSVVSTTFCPGSGCPCTAKICRECEDCPM